MLNSLLCLIMQVLLNGDLLFFYPTDSTDASSMSSAIIDATTRSDGSSIDSSVAVHNDSSSKGSAAAHNDSSSKGCSAASKGLRQIKNITHVAIIEVEENSKAWIIEASPKYGVIRTPFEERLKEEQDAFVHVSMGSLACDKIEYVDVSSEDNYVDLNECVQRAKALVGCKYDFSYMPDNDKYYCSELVYECYLKANGEKLFTASPMNFYAADGTLPLFWEQLFQELNMPVPQGVLGTNPQDMYNECFLVLQLIT